MKEKDKVFCIDQGGGKSQVNITEDTSPTLTTTHGGEPAVFSAGFCTEHSAKLTENYEHPPIVFEPGAATRVGGHVYDDEITGTLRANAGDNAQVICYGIDQQGGKGMAGYGVEVSPTLASESHGTPHAVCYGLITKGNGGCILSEEHHTALSTGGGQAGQGYPAVVYGISAYDSNAMKSPNPHSGIYEADTSRTLDLNGGKSCLQSRGYDGSSIYAK